MLFTYPAVFIKESDERYSVIFPDFDCATCGDSLPHATRMAQECLILQIRGMQDEEQPLPEPSEQTPELLNKTCLGVDANPDSASWGAIVVDAKGLFDKMDTFQKIVIISDFCERVDRLRRGGVPESLISEICGCKSDLILRALCELSLSIRELCVAGLVNALNFSGGSDDAIARAVTLLPSTVLSYRTWDADQCRKVSLAFNNYRAVIQRIDPRHYNMTLCDVLNTALYYTRNLKTYLHGTKLEG